MIRAASDAERAIDPGGLVRLYAALHSSSHLRAIDPVARRGLVPCPSCSCGSRTRRRDRVGVLHCYCCRRAWPLEERVELRSGSTRRATSGEHRIALYVDVGAALARYLRSRRWRWHARLSIAAALHPEWSIRRLTIEAANTWPHAPFSWRRERVAQLVSDGRVEMARRFRQIR